ncbi:GntR family transcriptional regulator [Micromonospora sp. Llam0]|uniref:GntR family transcriptional regulator n=1 Tax=Micromonospora sp. Llam0 TaxID=2485143 RepID=UPI000F47D6DC|nr:GntR family transcriptional regulator [Micromonospora sp. Llam0]ROO50809.1 GntR family transcriptional regulator [Micromonospora sp. Llam0]
MATKYDRIAADLRRKIQQGELPPGAQMPVETVLLREYRVSLATLRRALDQLAAEGLIHKQHGRGTFVRTPRQRLRRTSTRHQWEKDRARLPIGERFGTGSAERDTGLQMGDFDFSAEYFPDAVADEDLAEAFGIPVGTRLLERTYRTVLKAEESPLGLGRSFLIYDMIAVNPELLDASSEPWPGGTQNQLYTIGIELDRIEERVISRPPSLEEAESLRIDPGVAVFALRKVSIDTTGRVVEVADSIFGGDRTELHYVIQLERWK